MRVLVVTNMYPRREDPVTGVFVRTQVESLTRLGVESELEIIEGRRSKLAYLAAIGRVNARVRRERFDLVHAHYGLSGFVAVQQRQVPVVVSFCGSDLLGITDEQGRYTARGQTQVMLSRYAAARAAQIIVKTRQMGDTIPGKPWTVIPSGVDFELFAPGDRAAARRALELDPEAPYVLLVGRTRSSEKNFALAQAAMSALTARRPDARPLVMEGRPQKDVVAALNAADCLLLSSSLEGSPNAVKEAMACNLPVVSTRVGDVAEMFGDAPGHYLADASPEALADALEQALTFGRTEGRRQIEDLSVPAIARRVLAVYEAAA